MIIRENQEIKLTYTEFEIFKLLAKHPGIVFSKERIYDIVWKESYSGDYNIVMSHIRNIREKIEDNPSKPIYIQTVWGVGYRFNNEGNQVSYRCDVKRVTTINFDRNKIRKMCADLSKKSDETSAALDAALVNTPVEYEAPFDVNETFAEAFEAHMSALS